MSSVLLFVVANQFSALSAIFFITRVLSLISHRLDRRTRVSPISSFPWFRFKPSYYRQLSYFQVNNNCYHVRSITIHSIFFQSENAQTLKRFSVLNTHTQNSQLSKHRLPHTICLPPLQTLKASTTTHQLSLP